MCQTYLGSALEDVTEHLLTLTELIDVVKTNVNKVLPLFVAFDWCRHCRALFHHTPGYSSITTAGTL